MTGARRPADELPTPSWGGALVAVVLAGQVLVVGGLTTWVLASVIGRSASAEVPATAWVVGAVAAAASLPLTFRWIGAGVEALVTEPWTVDASSLATLPPELHRPPEVLAAMARTIRDALDARSVQIEVFPSTPARPLEATTADAPWAAGATATAGPSTAAWVPVPLTLDGRDHGVVRVAARSGALRSAGQRRLLGDLVRQVAMVVAASKLREELESTREHLVLAREEERRRIRRDLHDGLGPSLAGIKLQLSALRRQLGPASRDVGAVDEIHRAVTDATAEVRRVVEDLRPSMLDDCGLVEAIRNLQMVPPTLRLTVDAPSPLPPLPAAVEVALLRIAVEAVHNTVRHAGATRCEVALGVDRTHATLVVTDDGGGFQDGARAGVGTAAMVERAGELGGTAAIGPAPAGGTRVTAVLPLRAGTPT